MSAIRPDDIRHLARLAHLAVDDGDVERLTRELDDLLSHMQVLAEVPAPERTEGHAGAKLREDRVAGGLEGTTLEGFAPESRDGFFLVPRLDSHGDAGA